jgi:hypothetical protein
MMSESEVVWLRVKNQVGQHIVASDWHAVVPGIGADFAPPGVACGTELTGSRQSISNTGIKAIDGRKHGACVDAVREYVLTVTTTPGPFVAEEEPPTLVAPGS